MNLLAASLLVFLGGGVLSALAGRRPALARAAGVGSAIAGSVLGLAAAVAALAGRGAGGIHLAWGAYGSFDLALDPLSAFFLVPILLLSAVAALYGGSYLEPFAGRRNLGFAYAFYDVLAASMVVVVVAGNALVFLFAWELMALASFFLVAFEDEKEAVREASWTYLVAAHLGTAFLIPLFLALAVHAGSLDFEAWRAAPPLAEGAAGIFFVLAVVGFGAKAGFFPLHVWLPEAHPAAPSHVSAVLSGVMIKTGIYGLLRFLTFLGAPAPWWGAALVAVGVVSGVLGVLFALAQHDLKRLLAYHSVENIGIIALGLGLGLVGLSADRPAIAAIGFAGGLLHVLNHALFKGLLFLGAGSVLHASGTREIDELGGLLKKMPWTGSTFVVAAVAISGLPPLNGFVSEFLIYAAAFGGIGSPAGLVVFPSIAAIGALALIGTLAAACFTKAFGVVFLGEPRSHHAQHAHEAPRPMRAAMVALAIACVVVGLGAPLAVGVVAPAVAVVTGSSARSVEASLAPATGILTQVVAAAGVFLAVAAGLLVLRSRLLSGRRVGTGPTWDCGYARPAPRMQYTASSFADGIVRFWERFLDVRRRLVAPRGYFPPEASLSTEAPDLTRERLYAPLFRAVERALGAARFLQHGGVHLYVLYIALTLVALLLFKLG